MWFAGILDRLVAMTHTNADLSVSDDGISLVAEFEGWVPYRYRDGDEPGVPIHLRKTGRWTVGYGHLERPGEVWPSWPREMTIEEGRSLLRSDLARAAALVRKHITEPLAQHEFDALVSLAFNCEAAVVPSSSTLARELNAGNREVAADQFLVWIYANGKPDDRLRARRRRERAMFLGSPMT